MYSKSSEQSMDALELQFLPSDTYLEAPLEFYGLDKTSSPKETQGCYRIWVKGMLDQGFTFTL
jgi:hypothetical protein